MAENNIPTEVRIMDWKGGGDPLFSPSDVNQKFLQHMQIPPSPFPTPRYGFEIITHCYFEKPHLPSLFHCHQIFGMTHAVSGTSIPFGEPLALVKCNRWFHPTNH